MRYVIIKMRLLSGIFPLYYSFFTIVIEKSLGGDNAAVLRSSSGLQAARSAPCLLFPVDWPRKCRTVFPQLGGLWFSLPCSQELIWSSSLELKLSFGPHFLKWGPFFSFVLKSDKKLYLNKQTNRNPAKQRNLGRAHRSLSGIL